MVATLTILDPVRGLRSALWLRFRQGRRELFYLLARLLALGIRVLPSFAARWPLRGLARLAWPLRRGDRCTALRQLRLAFPDRSEAWRCWVGRTALLRMADNLVSGLRGTEEPWLSPADSRLLRDLAEEGRPTVVLMAHYGAWELAGPVLARIFPSFGAFTANPHNDRLDRWLKAERRGRGIEVFDRHRDRISAARWLRRGGTLAILADHRSAVATRPVPWFGRLAPTVVGPARLARWAGASILPVRVVGGPGHYELRLGPVLREVGEFDEDEVLVWCNERIEEWVAEDPTQWTWWHDRYGDEEDRDG